MVSTKRGYEASPATREQDAAAGGLLFRRLRLGEDLTATASVGFLKSRNELKMYAYLRFKCEAVNYKRYIGKVQLASRKSMLRQGWALTRRSEFCLPAGWMWLHR